MAEKKGLRPGQKNPIGDRQQFLTMSPEVVNAIKGAALKRNQPAWVIMEEAATEWLEKQKKNQRGT
jgi:hypothetical protein